MRTLAGIALGVLIMALAPVGAPVAFAAPNDKVDLQQDCGSPCIEGVDSTGPTGFGFVQYKAGNDGNLRLLVSLKNAAPDTTYRIFLVCGPTHVAGCGSVEVGGLTTNGHGNGTSDVIVLDGNPFAGGSDDHIDVLRGVADGGAGVYIATPVTH